MIHSARIGTIILLLSPLMAVAQKTDTIHLFNGDKVVGEMKELELGLLRVKTDYMATVYIEWDQIQTLRTNKRWDLRTHAGAHYLGTIAPADRLDHVVLVTESDSISIGLIEIISLYRLNTGIWARTDGSLNIGYSYQAANELTQFTLGLNSTYLYTYGAVNLGLNSVTTNQLEQEDIQKQDVSLGWERYLWNRWGGFLTGGAEKNTQLDLDLRVKLSMGMGYYLVQKVHTIELVGAGAQVNTERSTDGTETENLEVFLGDRLRFKTYRFPKAMLYVDLTGYYSLTVADRYRASGSASFKYELIKDLQIGIELYDQYDSKPPNGGLALNDFRVGTTLGWIF